MCSMTCVAFEWCQLSFVTTGDSLQVIFKRLLSLLLLTTLLLYTADGYA
jgi:sulfite reductase beta subunit-like hemoprotein